MVQVNSDDISASSDPGKQGGVADGWAGSKRPRVDGWVTSLPRWVPPDERWVFGYGLTNDKTLNGWGQPLPIGPYRLYATWFEHNKGFHHFPFPIECPSFPNVSDEDLFWLLRVIELRHHHAQPGSYYICDNPFTEGEMDLFQASIVLASKRALEGLDK